MQKPSLPILTKYKHFPYWVATDSKYPMTVSCIKDRETDGKVQILEKLGISPIILYIPWD